MPTPSAALTGPRSLFDRIGLPKALIFGYVAVLLFMVGDGVESAFISPFMAGHGAGTDVHAGYIITTYGVAVMVASWFSGALSDLWGPRRVMMIGFAIWLVFDILFLAVAVPSHSMTLMLIVYGIRGFGYPLFAFGFLVWITATAPSARMGAAVGWFYFAFTGGLPTLGALFASFTIPFAGEYGTLWLAVVIIAIGGLMAYFGIRERTGFAPLLPKEEGRGALVNSLTVVKTHPRVAIGTIVRVINTSPEFGMLVFLPVIFADKIGFGQGHWLQLVAIIYGTNIFFNLIFGLISDKIGWRLTISTFGAIGCAVSILLLYFLPVALGADYYWVAVLTGALYGATLAGFVPISALIPALAPANKGGAMAALNLGAGAAAFVGPAIASIFLPLVGAAGVIIIFAALYVASAFMTIALKLPPESKEAIAENKSLQEVSEEEAH